MRKVYKYCEVRKKVVEAHEALKLSDLANIKHGYIPDEMPPTKHPGDGHYYTSKSKFRETTKALGYEEIGTAYENGYDPSVKLKDSFKDRMRRIREEIRERYAHGR